MTQTILKQQPLPQFSEIKVDSIESELDRILQENKDALESLLANQKSYDWENLIGPLDDLDDRLNQFWSPISHLHSVADNEDLRKTYNACLPKLTDYFTEMGQNENLFRAYEQIANSAEYKQFNLAQKKVIENALRDFHLSGVDLDDDKKQEFKEVQQQLSKAQTKFEENLLDATHGWDLLITDEQKLTGLPASALALAVQNAKQQNKDGWLFTLDFPSYYPVMQYVDNADLRRDMYQAYVTRASEVGPNAGQWDNSELMTEILTLRTKLAQLLGYQHYAEYSLARKMAKSPDEVIHFLQDLAERSHTMAKQEYQELLDFVREHYQLTKLEPWDTTYYSEKLRQQKFAFSQEALRPYFPASQVTQGLFQLVQRLYGLKIDEVKNVNTWHSDVKFFGIHDAENQLRGGFYLDLYARQHKRGGAWMDECIVRKKTGENIQYPVAYLTCNFTPPVNGQPSLLTHDEVTTLFHEFGHGLHHMLTLVDYPGVSGINGVAWDAVELPSQFMENWCWERDSLDLIARHHKTGEPLPQDLFEKMQRAKNFQSGLQMVRQVEFSLFDFRLHIQTQTESSATIQALLDEVRSQVAVIKQPEYNRFQHSFSHIFAGGYAAGYYSYKWAEVLSADAFSKFEENGIFDRNTGMQFLHTILEQGGSRDPMDLFTEFRGRKPEIEALLRHSGIMPQTKEIPA